MSLRMIYQYVINVVYHWFTNLYIDVAIITETWLTAIHTHNINLMSSPPYTFIGRRSDSFYCDPRAGSIGIMYKSHISISSTNHV